MAAFSSNSFLFDHPLPIFSHQPNNFHPFDDDSIIKYGDEVVLLKADFSNNNNESSSSAVTSDKFITVDSPISVVVDHNNIKSEFGEHITQKKVDHMEKNKRKNRDGSYSKSSQSMDANGVKSKRQKKFKKSNNSAKKEIKEKVKIQNENDFKKIPEEGSIGYVHVRARRGQATDSHSLAERVRREKISERMKILQGLVPGCDKITGKALMLDEIINYVQTLQNQVEFLSMKVANSNPMLFDFETEPDIFMVTHEAHEGINDEPTTFSGDNYPLLSHATPSILFEEQIQLMPNILTHLDNGQVFLDDVVVEQREKLNNQLDQFANNLPSFH